MSIAIDKILQTKYVIINQGKVKLIHNISHIIIAILKSPQPRALHFDKNICK
jgi:hypothetical protein